MARLLQLLQHLHRLQLLLQHLHQHQLLLLSQPLQRLLPHQHQRQHLLSLLHLSAKPNKTAIKVNKKASHSCL